MHTKIRLHSWQLTSRLFEHYQSMVDGIRKLDCFFFHLQRKDCMEMCICICEYSSTVNCASVFVNIRYTPRRITNTIRYVYLTTSPNIRIYRGTPSFALSECFLFGLSFHGIHFIEILTENGNVIILMKFLSETLPGVVILTTNDAPDEENFLQWHFHFIVHKCHSGCHRWQACKFIIGTDQVLWINSSHTTAAYIRQWTGSALIQVMACHLFDAKPLPKLMLTYCQLDL